MLNIKGCNRSMAGITFCWDGPDCWDVEKDSQMICLAPHLGRSDASHEAEYGYWFDDKYCGQYFQGSGPDTTWVLYCEDCLRKAGYLW